MFRKHIYNSMKDTFIFDIYLNKKKTLNHIDYFFNNKVENSFSIWKIFNLNLWLKTYYK